MLGLILIYFVGKAFYDLADKYNKSKWLYAILGVSSYYGGLLLTAFGIGLFLGIFFPEVLESANEMLLSLSSIPFGVLICYLFYYFLKKSWASAPTPLNNVNQMIHDFGREEKEKNFE